MPTSSKKRRRNPAVTVIVPALNAARWIERTLASVQRQTVRDIEIIVVDDGSTDETAAKVRGAMRGDSRIRLIRQANGGVGRARNAGIAAARAPFVAPIDADDLWHPTRLERHLEAFAAAGEGVALVYSPFVRIDEDDRVRYGQPCWRIEGDVFERHLCDNFVCNGSGITVRTAVAREIGGYAWELRDAAAEGCEDWLFQLKIAYRYKFVCVPQYLIGYRASEQALSADLLQMARSGLLAIRAIERDAVAVARPLFWWPRARATGQLARQLANRGHWNAALAEIAREAMRNPVMALYLPALAAIWAYQSARSFAEGILPRRPKVRPRFDAIDPAPVRRRAPSISTGIWIQIYEWLGEWRLARQAGSVACLLPRPHGRH